MVIYFFFLVALQWSLERGCPIHNQGNQRGSCWAREVTKGLFSISSCPEYNMCILKVRTLEISKAKISNKNRGHDESKWMPLHRVVLHTSPPWSLCSPPKEGGLYGLCSLPPTTLEAPWTNKPWVSSQWTVQSVLKWPTWCYSRGENCCQMEDLKWVDGVSLSSYRKVFSFLFWIKLIYWKINVCYTLCI